MSTASPPPTTTTTTTAATPTLEREQSEPPTPLETLQSLFPETPLDLIEAVLDAHLGSVEGATESLLGMTDPTFVSDEPVSQLDSDAQLARQLEEEDRRSSYVQSGHSSASSRSPGAAGGLAYQPYVPRKARPGGVARGPAPPAPQQTDEGGRPKDELDQLAENFSKLAEQGKRTLGGLFSKVKEQINKLDATASPSTSGVNPGASTSAQGNRPWTPPSSTASKVKPDSTYSSVVPDLLPRPTSSGAQSQERRVPSPTAVLPSSSSSSSASASATTPEVSTSTTSSTSTSVTPAPTIPEEPKKDFSKIGLLPRQSISLEPALKDKSNDHDSDDDSEDLEYVRSPFDDD